MLLTATEPPPELLVNVFPWIEKERMALNVCSKLEGRRGQDNALSALLDLLVYFRRVLLQDAAVFFAMYPSFPIFKFSPFNSVLFQQFFVTRNNYQDRGRYTASACTTSRGRGGNI